MAEDDERQFVSLKRLAREWDTTPTTVRRLLREAGVKAFRLSKKLGGTIRYRLKDIEAFVEDAVEHSTPRDGGTGVRS